ncbi:MAG TPA: type II secretion system protein [Syntrophales bacterium]|nr:type II secretion system protein [Syntrophobacterales bacterium]HQL91237.1 type II secretion system protein [Syntrophales bacterium]
MKRKAGFTLIEIMVSLVLVGLIASIAGISVITATKSYLFARENNAITQKAQLALNRLSREIIELSDVRASDATCMVYESPYGKRAIARLGNTLRLFINYGSNTCPVSGGDILVDGIVDDPVTGKPGFSILYNPNPPDGTTSLWSVGQDITNLFVVNIQMDLARPDTGGKVPFHMTVSPRNNNNSGGAALPTAANPPPEYSGKQCFVTTAAYGDANHPVVETLRQFRDRFLLPTEAGEALVRFYYEAGPSLASAIEDRPVACLFVRLLITPLAGFAFLALTRPVLIPVVLLLSWVLARLAVRALRRQSPRWRARLQGERGAILVTLIAALVVFSALGALMIGMFGTSVLSQVAGNNAMKAYYLAESGFRYAASRYIAVDLGNETANEAARESLLENELHGKTFTLSGDGAFRLDVYPYYYKSTQAPSGNELTTKVFGGLPIPGIDFNWGSWVKVQRPDNVVTYNRISGVSTLEPNTIRFYQIDAGGNILSWDSAYGAGSAITPVCIPDRNVNSLRLIGPNSDGSYDLAFVSGTGARAFPEKNGIFTVKFQGETNPRVLAYRHRDIANSRLKGISDPNGGSLPTGPMVDPGTGAPYQNFVELTKFVRLESTGTIGSGTSAVSRKVTYYAPIGYAKLQPEPKSQFHDKMLDFSKWQAGDHIGRIGTLTAGTSYGTTMRVESTQATNATPTDSCLRFREFQVGLNWSAAALPVQQEWLRAGNYLSYDLEMKTFYTLPNPSTRYAIGLTFRLDEAGNAMGFTFARGVPGFDAYGCDNDGIPFGFLANIPGYVNYTPILLAWTKEYSKKEVNPGLELSVHSVSPTKYDDPPPTGTGTFALVTNQTFWRNGDRVRFVNTGGALPVGVTAGRDYYIRKVVSGATYLYLFDTLTAALNQNPPYWAGLQDITGPGSGTTTLIVQDASFTKLAHQVLTSGNEYLGLISSLYLKTFATFAARIIEAPSVSFVSGGGGAGREILSGETVYQTLNNLPGGTVTAIYRVMRSPVYRAAKSGNRTWSSGSEQGVLLLERIAGNSLSNPATAPFLLGYKIFVGEHPGGTDAGTVGVPGGASDEVFRRRDNWLMFYVGDPGGNAPADVNPFNNFRGPVFRNSVLWPPDNPQETVINTDNFTLLRFSDYVNSSLSCKVNGVDRTGPYCLTGFYSKDNTGSAGDVLRFASPDGTLFYSPQSGTIFPAGRSEVGLHAYGNDAYWTEFDDFALQFGPGYGITRQGFLLPIQQ